jgi:phosphatidylethanolamine/phosphatidyl-N-methylethanolamine N-methyltransferase
VDLLRWNRIRYTGIAPIYDLFVRFAGPRRRAVELLQPAPGARVLIVGCGTGADLPHLPADARISAVDLTPAMVERTRRRAAELGRTVRTEVMDASHLEFPDGSFDVVLLHLIVAVVPDPRGCIREAARVLRSGGQATVLDKFVPDGGRPSILRRLLDLPARVVATRLTRQLGPLLEDTPFRVLHREGALLGNLFEIILLEREG